MDALKMAGVQLLTNKIIETLRFYGVEPASIQVEPVRSDQLDVFPLRFTCVLKLPNPVKFVQLNLEELSDTNAQVILSAFQLNFMDPSVEDFPDE